MAIEKYRSTQVKSRELKLMQDAVAKVFRGITDIAILQGRLVEDYSLASGDNTIEHKLDREVRGYLIVKATASINVYDKQASNSTPTRTLVLNSSAAATASIWIF